jgi:hypothetical protein
MRRVVQDERGIECGKIYRLDLSWLYTRYSGQQPDDQVGGEIPRYPRRRCRDRMSDGLLPFWGVGSVRSIFLVPVAVIEPGAFPAWPLSGNEGAGLDKRTVVTGINPWGNAA